MCVTRYFDNEQDKSITPSCFYSHFLNWTNGTKSPKTSHFAHKTRSLKKVELLVNLRYSDISFAHVLTKTPKCHSSNPFIQNVFYSEKDTLQTLIYSHYTTFSKKILQKIYIHRLYQPYQSQSWIGKQLK